ncbi:MAG: hypothetical protein J0G96_13500 [Flavobacteriia bacterium]|nr:hypothetical protein [Flavobacteriia bacterium]
MENELSEHTFKLNDQEALDRLKELFEFTTPNSLRKSMHVTFFAYLEEQTGDNGMDMNFKEVIQDYFFLFDFLDKMETE